MFTGSLATEHTFLCRQHRSEHKVSWDFQQFVPKNSGVLFLKILVARDKGSQPSTKITYFVTSLPTLICLMFKGPTHVNNQLFKGVHMPSSTLLVIPSRFVNQVPPVGQLWTTLVFSRTSSFIRRFCSFMLCEDITDRNSIQNYR